MVMRQLGFFVLAASLALSFSNIAEANITPENCHTKQASAHTGSGTSGMASVYASRRDGYAGGRSASGERVSSGALTAAHKTFPFGTMVRSPIGGTTSRWSCASTIAVLRARAA